MCHMAALNIIVAAVGFECGPAAGSAAGKPVLHVCGGYIRTAVLGGSGQWLQRVPWLV